MQNTGTKASMCILQRTIPSRVTVTLIFCNGVCIGDPASMSNFPAQSRCRHCTVNVHLNQSKRGGYSLVNGDASACLLQHGKGSNFFQIDGGNAIAGVAQPERPHTLRSGQNPPDKGNPYRLFQPNTHNLPCQPSLPRRCKRAPGAARAQVLQAP